MFDLFAWDLFLFYEHKRDDDDIDRIRVVDVIASDSSQHACRLPLADWLLLLSCMHAARASRVCVDGLPQSLALKAMMCACKQYCSLLAK